ncbi:hypothetical protein BCR44DRAFT_90252, partial [Catenaria anguillulae PL171]
MSVLNPEWKVTNDAPNYEKPINPILSGIILTINTCSVLACIFIMVLFKRERALRTVPNYFVLNLTIADMLTSVTHGPLTLFATSQAGTSLMSLALISFERFMSTYKERPLQQHHVNYMVGGVWLENGVIAAIPYMLGQQYMPEPSNVFCMSLWTTTVPAWTLFAIITQLHLGSAFGVIVMSYYKIYNKVISIKAQLKGVKHKNQQMSSAPTAASVKDVKSLPGRPTNASTSSTGGASASTPSPGASMNTSTLASSGASTSPLVSASTAANASSSVATPPGHYGLERAQIRRPSWWLNMFGRASTASMLPGMPSGVDGQQAHAQDAPVEESSMVVRAVRSRSSSSASSPSTSNADASSHAAAPGVDQSAINALADANSSTNTRTNHSDGLNRTRKTSSLMHSLKQMRRRKSSAESNRNKLEQVLFRKSVIISCVFTMNWMPYIAVVMWQFITGYHLPPWYHTFAALGIYTNSFTNPVICLLLDTRWVKAAKDMLGIKGPEAVAQAESGKGAGVGGSASKAGRMRVPNDGPPSRRPVNRDM